MRVRLWKTLCVKDLKTFLPVIGSYSTERKEDGPLDKAKLSCPAGIASRSEVIYIAEHPPDYQSVI